MLALLCGTVLLVKAASLLQHLPSACTDGVLSNGESDVDCGGQCEPCFSGRQCSSTHDCYGAGIVCGVVQWDDREASAVCLDVDASSLGNELATAAPPPAFLRFRLLLQGVDLSWCTPELLSALQTGLAAQLGTSPLIPVIDRVVEAGNAEVGRCQLNPGRPELGLSGSTAADRLLRSGHSRPATRPCAVNVEIRLPLPPPLFAEDVAARVSAGEESSALCRAAALVATGAIPTAFASAAHVTASLLAPASSASALKVLSVLSDGPNATQTPAASPSPAGSQGGDMVLYGTRSAIIATLAVLGVSCLVIYACLCAHDMRAGPYCGVRLICLATACGLWRLPEAAGDGASREARAPRGGAMGDAKRGSLLPSSALLLERRGQGGDAFADAEAAMTSTTNPIGQAVARGSVQARASMDSRMLAAVARAVAAEQGPRDRGAPARPGGLTASALSDASFRVQSFGPSATGGSAVSGGRTPSPPEPEQ